MATLAYFDMFDYPLKKRELFNFLQQQYDNREFEQSLEYLVSECVVFKLHDLYSLHNNFSLVERRCKGNALADTMMEKARAGAKLLSKFPYVKAVTISGSLSKNFADDATDIDYFIITEKNRLWICRSFLHIFKKFTFLFNKQHLYCMNYFIDEAQLEIVEKNIFTATEIATIIPLYGTETVEDFYSANNWTQQFLPNYFMRVSCSKPVRSNWARFIIEKMFNNAIGNHLDRFLMKLTAKSWSAKSKKGKTNSRGIVMALDTSRHHAKPSAANFQQKLLHHYENKLCGLYENYENIFQATAGYK